MKEKKMLLISISFLILINIFALVRFYRFKRQCMAHIINNSNQVSNEVDDEIRSYKINFVTNILNSNSKLENIMIKDSLNNLMPITDVFEEGQKCILVCRFSEFYCESCVSFSLQMILGHIESIGVKNVLFLGNHRNNKIFNQTKPLYRIDDKKTYNTPFFNIPVEEIGHPYFFVLDSNLQISNVFIPNKTLPNISNEYLENIKSIF